MPNRRYRTGQALALAALLSAAAPATAAPAGGGAESEVDRQLRTVVAEAKAKVNADDYRGALRVLTDAYDRAPHPALLWPIAELYLQLQQPGAGLKILDRYVMLVPVNKMPPGQQLTDVAKMREQFEAMYAHLSVGSEESGATLSVDGKPVGQVPLAEPLRLDPGSHRIELLAGRSVVREVHLNPGDTGSVQLAIAADPTRVATAGRPHQRRVRTAAYALAGIGLGGVIAGAVLWGLDGLQTCPQAPLCASALDSKTTGVGLFSAGLGLSTASLVLLGIELSQGR